MIQLNLPPDDPKPDVQLQEPVGTKLAVSESESPLVPNAKHIIYSWAADELWLSPVGITRLSGLKVTAIDWRREAVAYRHRQVVDTSKLLSQGQDPKRLNLHNTIVNLRYRYEAELGVILTQWDLDDWVRRNTGVFE